NSRRYVREIMEGLRGWDELKFKVPPKKGSSDNSDLYVTYWFGDPHEATTGIQPVNLEASAPGSVGGVFLKVNTEDTHVPNADPLWNTLEFEEVPNPKLKAKNYARMGGSIDLTKPKDEVKVKSIVGLSYNFTAHRAKGNGRDRFLKIVML